MIKCKICGEPLTEEGFRSHPYSRHKIKIEEYFKKFYKKTDLFTGERIEFKSISQYLGSDFTNLRNLKSWIKTQNKDSVKAYCIDWLVRRKDLKNCRYIPCQVELKTLVFPPVSYLQEIFQDEGGYNQIGESLGYFPRFEPLKKGESLPKNFEFSGKVSVIQDTREGKPLNLQVSNVVAGLNWGDYAVTDEVLSGNCRIERKSLPDLIGTLSKNYERFLREIERAEKEKGYMVILVEETIQNLLSFKFLPHISKKIRATPEFICHRVREICQNYDNVQFLFVDGRKEAARLCPRVLQIGQDVKSIDLQLAYDLGLMN